MATELREDRFLASIGVAATNYGVLCCIPCGVAYSPRHLRVHVIHTHAIRVSATEYEDAWKALGISPELPSPPSLVLPAPAAGLTAISGLWCGHCTLSFAAESAMYKHQRIQHAAIPYDERRYTLGTIQQFNACTSRHWWRVAPLPAP